MPRIAGLLLAAGSGRRFGMPKALADCGDGPWVLRALSVLAQCDLRMVVIGAQADEVAALVPADVAVIVNPDHRTGMSSSLRIGLQSVPSDIDAVVVTLVDLPDLTSDVTTRVLEAAGPEPRAALARAVFDRRPGHPVLIGSDHLKGVLDTLSSGCPDAGAGRYLGVHNAAEIECGDLAGGGDRDTPDDPAVKSQDVNGPSSSTQPGGTV